MPSISLSRTQVLAVSAVVVVLLLTLSRLLQGGAAHTQAAAYPFPPPLQGTAAAAHSAGLLVVDVVGAVRTPGLQHLGAGSRVADAVARAGGATAKADLDQVNLAAPLVDGEQVVVPRRLAATAAAGAGTATGGTAAPAGPVSLSSASAEQLDTLPGVGPVTAQKIVAYRLAHGAFTSVAELDAIPGIGPARLEQLKGLVVP